MQETWRENKIWRSWNNRGEGSRSNRLKLRKREMNETQSYHRSCLYYPLAVARRQYLLTFFNVKTFGTIEEIVINAIEFRFVGSIRHHRVLKSTLFLLLLSNIYIYSYRINELSNATINYTLAVTQNYL